VQSAQAHRFKHLQREWAGYKL